MDSPAWYQVADALVVTLLTKTLTGAPREALERPLIAWWVAWHGPG